MGIDSIDDLNHAGQVKAFLIKGKIYRSIDLLSSNTGYYLQVKYMNKRIDDLFYSISDLRANKIIDDIKNNQDMVDYFQEIIRNTN